MNFYTTPERQTAGEKVKEGRQRPLGGTVKSGTLSDGGGVPTI